MASIIISRAGITLELVQSNYGVRMLHNGVEVIKYWPGREVAVAQEIFDLLMAPIPEAPPVDPPPTDVALPAAPQPVPTVASITVTGNLINVAGVSQAGTCFAMTNNNPNALSGETIEATAAVMFDVPAGVTTSADIGVVGKYLHLTIKANGLYSMDWPQRVGNTPPG
jgi:hypothetical protein